MRFGKVSKVSLIHHVGGAKRVFGCSKKRDIGLETLRSRMVRATYVKMVVQTSNSA